MPNNTSKISELADEASSAPSVLDFLYHDSRRIASFLSQFEGDGHLQQLTRTKGGTRGKRESSSHEAKGNLGVASGKMQGGTETALEMAEGYARVFDPYWANARAFLDYLSDRDLLQHDITATRIGQFVLVKGSLIVADLVPFREIWKSNMVRQFMVASANQQESGAANRQQRKSNQRGQSSPPTEADLVLELLPYLPHSSQIHIVTDEYAAWGTADSDYLTGSFADLALKHGAKIAGEWSALGILDGLPFEVGELMTPLEQLRVGMSSESVAKVPLTLAPNIRQMLGRPLLSYGITPLLIFREVS